jgi:uncharacterized protein (TIGR02246 family)
VSGNAKVDALVKTFLQLIAARDPHGVASLFADVVDWVVPGNPALPWVGRRSHRSEIEDYFRTLWEHLEPGKSSAVMDGLLIVGSDVVVFATFSHTAIDTGRPFRTPVALKLRVIDGAFVRLQLYEDTWAVSNAFSS